jgi:hypothetical protein
MKPQRQALETNVGFPLDSVERLSRLDFEQTPFRDYACFGLFTASNRGSLDLRVNRVFASRKPLLTKKVIIARGDETRLHKLGRPDSWFQAVASLPNRGFAPKKKASPLGGAPC